MVIIVNTLLSALRIVLSPARYRAIGLFSFVFFSLVNLLFSSTPFTGAAGLFGVLDVQTLARGLLMGAMLGLLAPFTVYLLRQHAKAQLGTTSVGLVCSGVACMLGPLCCGILSILLGWVAGLLPATAAFASGLFAALSRHETLLFYLSVLLLAYSLYRNAQRIVAMPALQD